MKVFLSGFNGKMGCCIRALCRENSIYDAWNCPSNVQPDVWIDFTHVDAFDKVLIEVQKLQCPLVMGTTGLSEVQKMQLKALSNSQAVVYDTNFSLGIQVLKQLLQQAASLLKDFDVHICEAHHKSKKDQPSGTALNLKGTLKDAGCSQVPISSIRAGGIHGQHEILFAGAEEMLLFKHETWDRSVFARGALRAAHWILEKKLSKGLYSMQDVLKA